MQCDIIEQIGKKTFFYNREKWIAESEYKSGEVLGFTNT